jgi:beta-lactamase regulating signal transducer with metallopeptidase domain
MSILTEARVKIADPTHWMKDQRAMDASKNEVEPWDPTATCFCLIGVMQAVAGQWYVVQVYRQLLAKSVVELFPHRIDDEDTSTAIVVSFNDHKDTTHADVLDVLVTTIARVAA